MSALPLPAATSSPTQTPVSVMRSAWIVASGMLLLGWIGFLAVLTVATANPPVVNALQIAASDLVFVGHWKNRATGEFQVERELKQGQLQGTVIVEDVPKVGPLERDAWVVPVVKLGKRYAVTHGEFTNRPALPRPDQQPWPVKLEPQCYPATNDVLEQIDAVLKRADK